MAGAKDDLEFLKANVSEIRSEQQRQSTIMVELGMLCRDLRGEAGSESLSTRVTRTEEKVGSLAENVKKLDWRFWFATSVGAAGGAAGGAALIKQMLGQ